MKGSARKKHDFGGPSSFSMRFQGFGSDLAHAPKVSNALLAVKPSFKKPAAAAPASLPSTFNGIITRPKIAGSILRDDRFIVSAPIRAARTTTTAAGAGERARLGSYYGDGMQRLGEARLHLSSFTAITFDTFASKVKWQVLNLISKIQKM